MKPLFDLTILGNPKAQQRHRHFRKGKFSGTYDPSKDHKANLLTIVQAQAPPTPLTGSLSVELAFFFSRIKGHFGTGKNAGILKKSAPKWHIVRPDIDNCAKMIYDCLNHVFWHDDSQICCAKIWKRYSDRPRTEIRIWKLDNEANN